MNGKDSSIRVEVDKSYIVQVNKAILKVLIENMVVDEKFTGKLVLNFNCGGITAIEKSQVFR